MLEQLSVIGVQVGFFLLTLAIGLGIVAAVYYGRKFIEAKLGAENYAQLKEGIATTVRALEQKGLIHKFDGVMKKRMAMMAARALRDQLGLDISNQQLDNMIEAEVQILNTLGGKFLPRLEMATVGETES
jgi:hypothetical protein